MTRTTIAWVVAITIATTVPAAAEIDPTKVAAAESLYRAGRKAMEAGDYEVACRKLAKSLELDRAIGTMWHLARCYEEAGRSATAWTYFLEVAAEARRLGRDSQEQAAQKRADALEERLCRLRLVVEGATPGLEVTLDDETIPRPVWNQAFPVDCGIRLIRSRKGDLTEETTAELTEPGATVDVAVPIPTPDALPEASPPTLPEVPQSSWYGDWVGWSLVAGGVGAGALAVDMNHRANTVEQSAGESGLDLATRDERFDDADSKRLIAVSAAGVGAALLVTGVVRLMIHDDSGAAVTPTEDGAMATVWVRF